MLSSCADGVLHFPLASADVGFYHTLLEVAAKDAARDCGATGAGDTRQMCKEVWDQH